MASFLGNKALVGARLGQLRLQCHTVESDGPSLRSVAEQAKSGDCAAAQWLGGVDTEGVMPTITTIAWWIRPSGRSMSFKMV